MNLLIFLDLTYNPCKNFKSYSLQGQNVQIFLIFTYNQGGIFLILPITQGTQVYLVSIGSCPPARERTTQAHRRQEEKMATCCSKQEEVLQAAE